MRVLTIYFFRNGLVYRYRKNLLSRNVARLHLIAEERILLEYPRFLQRVGSDVIGSQRNLLILVIMIIIIQIEVGTLFRCHHLTHQLYRRIILTRVFLFLWLNDDLLQHLVGRPHAYVQFAGLGRHREHLSIITHHRESQSGPSRSIFNGILTVDISNGTYTLTVVIHIKIRNRLARISINYHTMDLSRHTSCHQKQQ